LKLYIKNTATGARYEVIKLDKKTGKVILKGMLAQFDIDFDPDLFQRLGYELVEEQEDAVVT
jgi:hypothetical protein